MYLLDTDTLSNLIKRSPSTFLIGKLAAVPVAQQFTSSITVGELYYGAHRASSRAPELLRRIESLLLAELTVLPFDSPAARRYGAIRADMEHSGTPISEAAMRIASIALARNLVIVTGNARHFLRIPHVRVEDWLDEVP
jgi:predicted nucleic acid-binding protein